MEKKEFTILSKYENVTKIAREIRNFCNEYVIDETKCNELEISLVESLNNIIRHAYRENFFMSIDISIEIDNEFIIIETKDEGIPRTNFEKPELNFDPEDIQNLPESGMGLFIIDQLMDEHTYKTVNSVNIFTMKKSIK